MEKLRGDEPEYSEADSNSKEKSKKSVKSVPRDTSRKGRTSAGGGSGSSNSHLASSGSGVGGGRDNADNQIAVGKMESDIKKLKVDLQLSRNKENDLRDQIVSYMTGKNNKMPLSMSTYTRVFIRGKIK